MTKVGTHLLAFVPPALNGGQDHAPAVITHDRGEGVVDLYVHGYGPMPGATVYPDRAAAETALGEHFKLLPGHKLGKDKTVEQPGVNPQTGEPWELGDVAHWTPAAYHASDDEDQAAAAEPVAEESTAAKRARLLAELDALGAE